MTSWPGTGTIWMLGCGNMGGALLRRWLEAGLDAKRVTVIDPAPPRIEDVRWVGDFPDGQPDVLILGIKPQMLGEVAPALSGHLGRHTLLLSMLAGIDCALLLGHFPSVEQVVRMMPNLPVSLGKGVTGLYSPKGRRPDVDALMADTGLCEWLDDEDQFHGLTAVSGSGPAFVYRFIGAVAAAGAGLGLSDAQSLRLARATVEGAAALAIAADQDPVDLARQVTSAGGTTAAGLAELDQDGIFNSRVTATLQATAKRSRELGRS